MKAPTWLMAQVYRSDDAIKHVVKYFKAEAEKAKNPKEPNGILKSLMRDNWKIRESRMASVSSIFGIGSELRQSAADEDVETSFGVIVLDDSMVRVHLLSPHASLTNSNKLVSGTMVVLIKERLPQPSESLADDNNAEGEKVYTGREVTVRARVKSKPEPESPSPGTYGTVVLKVVFSASGTVTNISVVVGLPNGLTEAAIKAARKISFEPAIKDGR
jgi:TonB family protein